MRRSLFVIVLLTLVVAAVGSAVGERDTQAQPAGPKREPVPPVVQTTPEQDVISQCVHGAESVKVLIDLHVKDDHCVPEVTPSSVCVRRGGKVQFTLRNDCGFADDPDRPAVVIEQPSPKRGLVRRDGDSTTVDLFQDCERQRRFEHLKKGASPTATCLIHPKAAEGFYKYALKGQIDWLDPDVEVHQ